MSDPNLAFAFNGLAQFCRNHGIYELRQALMGGAQLAGDAENNEALAVDLEKMAQSALAPKPVPAPVVKPEPAAGAVEEHTKERSKTKARQ